MFDGKFGSCMVPSSPVKTPTEEPLSFASMPPAISIQEILSRNENNIKIKHQSHAKNMYFSIVRNVYTQENKLT